MATGSPSSDQLTARESFYGLSSRPFSLTPDPRFAFHSRSHANALAQVSEALRRREGLIVVTGEIGTGKTMLCRALLEVFEPRTFLSVILDPRLTVDELLDQVLTDFGLITDGGEKVPGRRSEATRHQLVVTLQRFLASLVSLNAHAVIMIDEAQHLSPEVLEEIRLLSNFETDSAKLLQIVLVGQPDLDTLLRRPDLRQINQRVARRFELQPLSDREVQEYIEWRLSVAAEGATLVEPQHPFTTDAMRTVATVSGGIPRVVNILCDRALELGYERQSRTIDPPIVLAAAEHLKLFTPAASGGRPRASILGPAAAALLVAAGVGAWWWWGHDKQPVRVAPPPPRSALQTPSRPAAAPTPTQPVAAAPASQPRPPAAATAVTPPPKPAPAGTFNAPRYEIAVAAFRTASRAADVAANLSAKGLRVSTRTDPAGTWHQIVAGPYASAEEADAAMRTIVREGFPDARVSLAAPPTR